MSTGLLEFIAAGGNEHPSTADVDDTGLIAFGAGQNVALWRPSDGRGIITLLPGHTGVVTAVRFLHLQASNITLIVTGAADCTVRVWAPATSRDWRSNFVCQHVLEGHSRSINAIAVFSKDGAFVTGAADSELRFWKTSAPNEAAATKFTVDLLQTISTKPTLIPLALAVARVPNTDATILAVGGSKAVVQIYSSLAAFTDFSLAATLPGHEGWIRSLDFVMGKSESSGAGLLLASASQDKYIRLWKIVRKRGVSDGLGLTTDKHIALSSMLGGHMTNKVHRFATKSGDHSITFEALLVGHEDWIFSVRWLPSADGPKLLSASADNSLAIWEPEQSSGVWTCTVRLGEISAQKGATTATGSAGGFWLGLWYEYGRSVLSLGKTGSWRLWRHHDADDEWAQDVAVGGHTRKVNGIAWAKDGSYLLSTSSDKTTRLFAPYKEHNAWLEFSRPQIHGYELNCIDSISTTRFISGADEKLLRVFDEPRAVAERLLEACGIGSSIEQASIEAANMPVLGLSNKAIIADEPESNESNAVNNETKTNGNLNGGFGALDKSTPPIEDMLSRSLLWPETEKLYGHGYEICAVAVSADGSLIATACRASSVTHAAIRIYKTDDWQLSQLPLEAHSLTVTRLRFSPDDRYLLSVSRDRSCAVFELEEQRYSLLPATLRKAHSRMILDATWLPGGLRFATAGRDKAVRIWRDGGDGKSLEAVMTIQTSLPVTAIDAHPESTNAGQSLLLAYGLEDGSLMTCKVTQDNLQLEGVSEPVPREIGPSGAVTQVSWRPLVGGAGQRDAMLAVSSEDCSVRIYKFAIE